MAHDDAAWVGIAHANVRLLKKQSFAACQDWKTLQVLRKEEARTVLSLRGLIRTKHDVCCESGSKFVSGVDGMTPGDFSARFDIEVPS
jgi:hypothetical protein